MTLQIVLYPKDFGTWKANCVSAKTSAQPGRNFQSKAATKTDRNLPVYNFDICSVWVSIDIGSRLHNPQVIAQRYLADLQEYLAVSSGEVATVNIVPCPLDGEVDWELADLTEGPR